MSNYKKKQIKQNAALQSEQPALISLKEHKCHEPVPCKWLRINEESYSTGSSEIMTNIVSVSDSVDSYN